MTIFIEVGEKSSDRGKARNNIARVQVVLPFFSIGFQYSGFYNIVFLECMHAETRGRSERLQVIKIVKDRKI